MRSSTSRSVGFARARCHLPSSSSIPEDVLEPVGDREAAILGALGDDALGPEVHRKLRPVVLAGGKLGPLLLQLLLPRLVRHEPPERRHHEHDPVVEVGFQSGATRFTSSSSTRSSATKPPAPRSRDAPSPTGSRPALHQVGQLALLVGELRGQHVVLQLEEAVVGQPVGVQPDAVAT